MQWRKSGIGMVQEGSDMVLEASPRGGYRPGSGRKPRKGYTLQHIRLLVVVDDAAQADEFKALTPEERQAGLLWAVARRQQQAAGQQ